MVSFELWLGIEGKHVSFLELWLRTTSLKLWFKMEDEHWTFLKVWLRMVCVIGVSVQVVGVVARTEGSTRLRNHRLWPMMC